MAFGGVFGFAAGGGGLLGGGGDGGRNWDLAGAGFFALWQADLEDAVFDVGGDAAFIDAARQADTAHEAAVRALHATVAALYRGLLLDALDGQHVVLQRDIQRFL